MDIDEQKNWNCSYLMRGYSQNLKSKWRTKEKKHEFTIKKWCYRLYLRNHLTFRAGTHVVQELTENYQEKMFKFTKLNEAYREQNDLELSQIENMDETLIFLNMTRSKTIAKIGSKTINIKTHGQEKFG